MITHKSPIKEIAKQVRKDIKDVRAGGQLHCMTKVSVRIQRYSMGRSLQVSITRAGYPIHNPEHLALVAKRPDDWWTLENTPEKFSDQARRELQYIDEIVRQYYRNDSDSQTDYYNVNFSYGGCDFDYKLLKEDRKKQQLHTRMAEEPIVQGPDKGPKDGHRYYEIMPDEGEAYVLAELEHARDLALEALQEAQAVFDNASSRYLQAVQVETLREAAKTAREVADKHLADAEALERALCDRVN